MGFWACPPLGIGGRAFQGYRPSTLTHKQLSGQPKAPLQSLTLMYYKEITLAYIIKL